jgi:hypothetical protein
MQVGADAQTIYRAIDGLSSARFDEVFADAVTGTGEDAERVQLADVAPFFCSGGPSWQLDARVRIGCCRHCATHPSISSAASISVAASSRVRGGEGVVGEMDVTWLVHAAVVDAAIGKLDGCGLNTHVVSVNSVDTAAFAEQHPVRERGIVLPSIRAGAGRDGDIRDGGGHWLATSRVGC